MKTDKQHWDRVKKRTMSGVVSTRIKKLYNNPKPIKLLLYNNLCPGDLISMSASIEMIHQQYPGRFLTDVICFHPDIYMNNPHITKLDLDDPEVIHLWTTYPLINKSSRRPLHFMEAYLDWFRKQLDIDLVLDTKKPYLYLTDKEKHPNWLKNKYGIDSKIALVVNGWKNDYVIKRWDGHYYQEVVDYFKDKITFVQTGLLNKKFHNHPPLRNVIDLRGKTSVRDLMVLGYHSQFAVCPVTSMLWIMASHNKNCFVIGGAREPTAFTHFPLQRTFSTVGCLPCCSEVSCWRSRVIPLNDGDKKDKRCCQLPMVGNDGEAIAKCMAIIKPRQVIDAIEQLYEGGIFKYNEMV